MPDEIVPFELYASDSDSEIEKIEVYLNRSLQLNLTQQPYSGLVRKH